MGAALIIVLLIVLVAALAASAYFASNYKSKKTSKKPWSWFTTGKTPGSSKCQKSTYSRKASCKPKPSS